MTAELPELPQKSIDRIETAVLAQIAQDRGTRDAPPAAKPRRRRRGWLTGIGVAAAFVAGVLITPPVLNLTTNSTLGEAIAPASDGDMSDDTVSSESAESADSAGGAITSDSTATGVAGATDEAEREVIASAHATVRVRDIADAVDAVSALAEEHDGYVEGTDIAAAAMSTGDTTMPVPDGEYGWVSIRVPSADLAGVVSELDTVGTVIATGTSQQDVTSAAIDLRARVKATQASVDRLTELMSQSGSVSELIDAEVALTDRQAQLESYTQQLAALEDQVAMSSLYVQLTEAATVAPAEPAGFADGLLAGWNGLIVSLNGLVIALGFLLPWLIIAGVVALVVWLVVRRRRRGSAAGSD